MSNVIGIKPSPGCMCYQLLTKVQNHDPHHAKTIHSDSWFIHKTGDAVEKMQKQMHMLLHEVNKISNFVKQDEVRRRSVSHEATAKFAQTMRAMRRKP